MEQQAVAEEEEFSISTNALESDCASLFLFRSLVFVSFRYSL